MDSMSTMEVEVERPVVPISMEISEDPKILEDPSSSFPIQVSRRSTYLAITEISSQATLKYLDDQDSTEVVHAKFVIGTDGE